MRYDVDGLRLNVVEEGSGPPLILLHPLGGSWRAWEAHLDDLGRHFRCLAVDLPGFGASDRRVPGRPAEGAAFASGRAVPAEPTGSEWASASAGRGLRPPNRGVTAPTWEERGLFEGLADDLAALCGRLGVQQAAVVGLSMGGMVAQHLALRHPELVSALVLVATTCRSDPVLRDATTMAAGMIREYGLANFIELGAQASWGPTTLAERPELVRRYQREEGCTDPDVYADAVEAVAGLDLRDAIAGGLKAPVLLVRGEHDGWMPETHFDELVAALPEAQTAILPGAGHLGPIEQPEAFCDIVRTFLGEHLRSAP